MEAILKCGSRVSVEAAQNIRAEWSIEQEGFYALEHAQNKYHDKGLVLAGVSLPIGYIDCETVKAALVALGIFDASDLSHECAAFGWLSSNHNITLCLIRTAGSGGVVEYRRGRRHGVRQILGWDASYEYRASERTDTHPNCVGLHPVRDRALS